MKAEQCVLNTIHFIWYVHCAHNPVCAQCVCVMRDEIMTK